MKPIALLLPVVFVLSACSNTPVLEPFQPSSVIGERATVWSDNGNNFFIMIKKIDGKGTPSRGGVGLPYSVYLSPGVHQLSLYVSDLSGNNVYISQYAYPEITVAAEAGHSYALRLSPSRQHAIVNVVDLGNSTCQYEVAGKMSRGYVPVSLKCN